MAVIEGGLLMDLHLVHVSRFLVSPPTACLPPSHADIRPATDGEHPAA